MIANDWILSHGTLKNLIIVLSCRRKKARWKNKTDRLISKVFNNKHINTFEYLEHDTARGILKFQSKPWKSRATSCSIHPDVFYTDSFKKNNNLIFQDFSLYLRSRSALAVNYFEE